MKEEQRVETLSCFVRLYFGNGSVGLLICYPKVSFQNSQSCFFLPNYRGICFKMQLIPPGFVGWGKGRKGSVGTCALIPLARLFPNIHKSIQSIDKYLPWQARGELDTLLSASDKPFPQKRHQQSTGSCFTLLWFKKKIQLVISLKILAIQCLWDWEISVVLVKLVSAQMGTVQTLSMQRLQAL